MKLHRDKLFTRSLFALPCLLLTMPVSGTAFGRAFIDMGPKDQIAGHQPQAQIEVFTSDGLTSLGPASIIDDPLGGLFGTTSTLLVDTGASSVFLMNGAETAVRQNGLVIENQVFEQGVSGFSLVNVSAPYQVRITGDDGATHVIDDNRMLSGQFPDLFGVNGLIGMPGMLGRVMSIDLDVSFDPNDIFSFELPKTTFSSSLPPDLGHRYSIPLIAKSFDIEDADPPLPTSAPLPMLTVEAGLGNQTDSGQFILDTGASISFISSEIASNIGLDSNGDGLLDAGDDLHFDTLPIGGVGGTIEAHMFLIDTFKVATDQNVDLIWDEVFVLVLDIHPEIDGVFGSDVVTSGLLNLLGLGTGEGSPTEAVSFDFRDFYEEGDTGKLVFDLNETFDVVQQNGDFDGDGDVDADDLVAWEAGNYNGTDFLTWQRNLGDGVVADAQDLATWQAGYNSGIYNGSDFLEWQRNQVGGGNLSATSAVPEPSSLILLLAGLGLVCRRVS